MNTNHRNQESGRIRKTYQQRITAYREKLAQARHKSRSLSSLRLLVFLAAAGLLAYGYYGPNRSVMFLALPLPFLFVYLIVHHARLNDTIRFLEKMVQINETAVLRLDGKWVNFVEDGSEYLNHNHPYTTDLNIFGRGSLFQYVYVPVSFGGRQVLVDRLRMPPSFEEISLRQEAVADLAPRLDFRQHMQATAMEPYFAKQNPKEVLTWLEQDHRGQISPPGAVFYLPFVTLALFILAAFGWLNYTLPLGMLALQALVAFWGEREASRRFGALEKPVLRLKRYAHLLAWIEPEDFTASYTKQQKQRLMTGALPASELIGKLVSIAERNDLRYSSALLYYPLNIALFWDLWTLRKLDAWQKKWGRSVKEWFEALAEIEALLCLAGLSHDNPEWVFPTVQDGAPYFEAKNAAHPLLPSSQRIGNDIALPKQGRVLMITGSNMSGKSTFLRTVGINLVLAYTGAPVCAKEMACSPMHVFSKMQIHDDLKERISTFYAELKRMKMILDAAHSKEPLLFLLDEIFRGTNSRDRVIATRTVIRQLYKLNTIGLVSTHDLELGSLAKEYPGTICNYHFTDDIHDEQIHFDYKIKPGISQTANAVALMRMIGIGEE